MKSIQKSLSSELEEIIRDYTNGDDMTVGALAQEIITVFKSKWLEMIGPDFPSGALQAGGLETEKRIIENKLRQELRQQISKEEI